MTLAAPNMQCEICQLPFEKLPWDRAICPFCSRFFGRADAAMRHAKTCRFKEDQDLPPAGKRGRNRRACDGCVRIKVACDAKTPCGRCSVRGLPCVYSRFCRNRSHLPGRAKTSAGRPPSVATDTSGRGRSMVPFLLNCTNPSVASVNEILANEPAKDAEGPTAWEEARAVPLAPTGSSGLQTIDPRLLFSGLIGPFLNETELGTAHDDHFLGVPVPTPGTGDGGLASRVNLLLSELLEFMDMRSHLGDGLDRFALQEFYSSSNCQKFMSAAYRRRHYHSPLLHWATLDLDKVALPLLLGLLLTGAAYSHWHHAYSGNTDFPRRLHVLADKYIFHHVKRTATGDATRSKACLQMLQGAYLINYLNIGMNDTEVRRKVLVKRHPTLVMCLRNLGILHHKHEPPWAGEDTAAFTHRESSIRLNTWTFLTDALLTLFFNNPPVMALTEMPCRLPCSEEVWDRASPTDSDIQRAAQNTPLSGLTLQSLVSKLITEEEWTDTTVATYSPLTIRHLHAAIFALQHMIFNWHTMIKPRGVAQSILRALDRWKLLWDRAIARITPEAQQWLGVARHAPEIAWLSRRIIEVSMTRQTSDIKYLQRCATYDLADFHQFIRQFGASGDGHTGVRVE